MQKKEKPLLIEVTKLMKLEKLYPGNSSHHQQDSWEWKK